MQDMTAIAITSPGGPEVLRPVRLPVPVPGPGEILVRVKAAGVNRPDVLQRQGAYPPPPGAPGTPGLEIAGEVTALGEGISWSNCHSPMDSHSSGTSLLLQSSLVPSAMSQASLMPLLLQSSPATMKT